MLPNLHTFPVACHLGAGAGRETACWSTWPTCVTAERDFRSGETSTFAELWHEAARASTRAWS